MGLASVKGKLNGQPLPSMNRLVRGTDGRTASLVIKAMVTGNSLMGPWPLAYCQTCGSFFSQWTCLLLVNYPLGTV